jgi:hypothetical protein
MQTTASMPHCGNKNGTGRPAITFEPTAPPSYIKWNKEKMLLSIRFSRVRTGRKRLCRR